MSLRKAIKTLILGRNTYMESYADFKQVMLSGYFAITGMIAFLLYFSVYFDQQSAVENCAFFFAALLMATTIYFHRRRKHVVANFILLGTVNVTTFLFTSSESFRTGAFTFFVVCIMGAFSLFGYVNRKSAIFFALLSVVLFILSYTLPVSILPFRYYPDEFLSTIAALNAGIALIASTIVVALLISLNHYNTRQLDENNKLLVKANEELDRFVYSTSHDLRAPLTSIMGLINIIGNTRDRQELDRYLGMMRDRIHSLDHFIKDITDYSRNNRKEIGKENVNLKELATQVWEELKFAPEAALIHFDIQVDDHIQVTTDRNRLKVVLSNLISNAIRYHDRGKASQYIRLVAENSDTGLSMKVEDNGQGIAPEYHRKIFEMFFRANEGSKGSGLGLYIVKETLSKLSGTISLDSRPGAGSSFKINLPRR